MAVQCSGLISVTQESEEIAKARALLESAGYIVAHKKALMRLSPIRQRILEFVIKRGPVTAGQIRDYVWSSDPNAPESEGAVSVHIYHLNKKLKPYGYKISSSFGPNATYEIKRVEV